MPTKIEQTNARLRKWMDKQDARRSRGTELKKPRPRYANKAENEFFELAKAWGWSVTKEGYPDFICYRPDGKIQLVEVKTSAKHTLSSAQKKFMQIMTTTCFGPPCSVWTSKKGLSKWVSR
jgi:hypothetical protein